MYALENHSVNFANGDWIAEIRKNQEQLDAENEQACKAYRLVGRVIRHPFADGYAVYQIVKENKRTVRIVVCMGLGDDWIAPAWGSEATVSKEVIKQFIWTGGLI